MFLASCSGKTSSGIKPTDAGAVCVSGTETCSVTGSVFCDGESSRPAFISEVTGLVQVAFGDSGEGNEP